IFALDIACRHLFRRSAYSASLNGNGYWSLGMRFTFSGMPLTFAKGFPRDSRGLASTVRSATAAEATTVEARNARRLVWLIVLLCSFHAQEHAKHSLGFQRG